MFDILFFKFVLLIFGCCLFRNNEAPLAMTASIEEQNIKCGKPPTLSSPVPFIVNGQEVKNDREEPWLAYIQLSAYNFSLGGTIIGQRWILTTGLVGKYLNDPKLESQIKGNSVGSRDSKSPNMTVAKLKEVHFHPDMHPILPDPFNLNNSFTNNIALVELADPLPLGPTIWPICLNFFFHERGGDPSKHIEGEKAMIAGWGGHQDGIHWVQPSPILNKGVTHLLSMDYCRNMGRILMNGTDADDQNNATSYTSTHLCTYRLHPNSTDFEEGDEGTPVMLDWSDRRLAIAIHVSFGPKIPGFYVEMRISAYCDWIANVTSKELKCLMEDEMK